MPEKYSTTAFILLNLCLYLTYLQLYLVGQVENLMSAVITLILGIVLPNLDS